MCLILIIRAPLQCFHTKHSSHSMSKISEEGILHQNNDQINDFSNLDFKSWIFHVNLPNRSGLTRCSMITLSYIFISAAHL